MFDHLQAILKGWEHVGSNSFQLNFDVDWNDFHFAHIPIGVLSQVYETFSHQWDEEHAERTSVYYTPRNIAKLLVEEAFAGLKSGAEPTVLDPACGAGVFLVLAFRELVRAYWAKNKVRPDTRAIQRILYKQLRGFEVSESGATRPSSVRIASCHPKQEQQAGVNVPTKVSPICSIVPRFPIFVFTICGTPSLPGT